MSKVYAVINQKGGVSKTTTVFNMASEIANRGKKVLVIDMDPQANLTSYMGFDEEQIEDTIADIFNVLIKGESVSDLSKYIINRKNLDLIASSIALAEADTSMALAIAREYLLKKVITPLKEHYDYIIIDCPPTLGLLVINILTASDEIIIPIKASKMNIKGFKSLLNITKIVRTETNPNLRISGVLITMFDSRLNAAKAATEYLEGYCPQYGIPIFKTKIGYSTIADLAFDEEKTIAELNSKSNLARQYMSFVEEVLVDGRK